MRRRIERTEDLGSVVRTMKALAASSIGQYEDSVRGLADYYRTVILGLSACLTESSSGPFTSLRKGPDETTGAVVFGSDQGLVGQFNEVLSTFVSDQLPELPGDKKIWAVGERIYSRLLEDGLEVEKVYRVPNAVDAITPLIGQILIDSRTEPFYIFHNRPKSGAVYEQTVQRLLPLDEQWIREMRERRWITQQLPEVLGSLEQTLSSLVREYLFVTLFKACAESLASENTARLAAMQRAEKNIGELLEDLQQTYHRVRQNTIDEELFDIVAGFEALEN